MNDFKDALSLWKSAGVDGLAKLNIEQLKDELRLRNLKVSGKKSDLLQRLDECFTQIEQKRKNEPDEPNENNTSNQNKKQKTHITENQETVYVLNVKIKRHNCLKRISVPASMSVDEGLEGILRLFNFDFDHLFELQTPKGKIEAAMGKEGSFSDRSKAIFSDEITWGQLNLHAGVSMGMLYDFGDCWNFEFVVQSVEQGPKEVKLLSQKGKVPPQYDLPSDEEEL